MDRAHVSRINETEIFKKFYLTPCEKCTTQTPIIKLLTYALVFLVCLKSGYVLPQK